MKNQFKVPVLAALVVVIFGMTLLTIGARSPYTHSNLDPGYDPRYTRTDEILVGSPAPIMGPMLARMPPTSESPVVRGQQLFVGMGCAECHGLEGRGGPVAPPNVGFSAEDLRAKMNQGPGGMPVYSPQSLNDEDLAAIVAYLQSKVK
jgi:mono/diheme cytochrome c family protein